MKTTHMSNVVPLSRRARETDRAAKIIEMDNGKAKSGPSKREPGIISALLALDILEFLAGAKDPVGVGAIAAKLGITKSRSHRHLRTLLKRGYIYQSGNFEKYRIGSQFARLSLTVADNFQLANIGAAAMALLSDTLGHFTVLSEPEDIGLRIVATRTGRSTLAAKPIKGLLLTDLCGTAQGKLCLAFGNPVLFEQVCGGDPEAESAQTLKVEIDLVRKQGYATAQHQRTTVLAAPVFGIENAFRGCVAVVDSIRYLPPEPGFDLISQVVEAGRQISRLLGGDMFEEGKVQAAE